MTDLSLRPLLAALLLALWVGAALIVATAVAPAAFAALPTRALAGAVVGRVLPVVFWSGIASGVVAALLSRVDLRYAGGRMGAAALVAVACAVAQLLVAPRIERLRAAIGPSLDALPPGDARRAQFGQLHAFSVLWMGVAMLAAVLCIVLTVLALRPRS